MLNVLTFYSGHWFGLVVLNTFQLNLSIIYNYLYNLSVLHEKTIVVLCFNFFFILHFAVVTLTAATCYCLIEHFVFLFTIITNNWKKLLYKRLIYFFFDYDDEIKKY